MSVGSIAYADEELIKRGDTSDDVVLLQQLLKDCGYFNYENITGYYGIITENAVKEFQKDNGLKTDGITGPATWAALLSNSSSPEDNSDNNDDTDLITDEEITYSIGMENADIALIQSRLIDLGFYNYNSITGYFGPITYKAVSAFQKSCSIKATGIVDSITWNKLFDDYAQPALLPGTVSDRVIPLQTRLNELGYYSFKIDGNYGPKTKEAVQYFQKVSGLTANGIADVQTQEILFSDAAINEQNARRIITTQQDDNVLAVRTVARAEDVVELAKQYIGYPYVYGAEGPDAFDSAGFISYIYDLVGITAPDTVFIQSYDNYGTKIYRRQDLIAGDLVFFDTVFADGNLADHIGIYIGDGNFIHVDEGFNKRAVSIDSLITDNGWYTARYAWGIRIIKDN